MKSMPNTAKSPQDYKHIAAWGRMMHSYQYYIKDQQQMAFDENAPIDAIFKRDNGTWATFSGVTHQETIQDINSLLEK